MTQKNNQISTNSLFLNKKTLTSIILLISAYFFYKKYKNLTKRELESIDGMEVPKRPRNYDLSLD